VQRIVELKQSETVLFLKEVSGLEMKRPIRGTIIQRDGQHPIVADETVLVMYTLSPPYEQLAYALFGLLSSLTCNFLFSLFSTNAHANFKEILRLPVPLWSPSREQQLAEQTREVLHAYQDVYEHERKYGTLTYIKGGKDILLPNPRVASAFLSQLETVERERAAKLQTADDAQRVLDIIVMDAYGITIPLWREVIDIGVPWAKG
jgi:hypothetical protein